MLGDTQRELRYIIIFVYIIIGSIDEPTAGTEINNALRHTSGNAIARNLWN